MRIPVAIPASQAFRPLADEKGTCGLVKSASLMGRSRLATVVSASFRRLPPTRQNLLSDD
jgi:hypothetical protein